mgnify:CR=1 FL=1
MMTPRILWMVGLLLGSRGLAVSAVESPNVTPILTTATLEKYGRGKGLTVLADGKTVAYSAALSRMTGGEASVH